MFPGPTRALTFVLHACLILPLRRLALARSALCRPHQAASRRCWTMKGPAPVSDMRANYSLPGLDEATMPSSPFEQFTAWMVEAQESEEPEPNAMTLATVGENGRPTARVVLLKGFDEAGFVWYTNYTSRKAMDVAETPFAALTFWWAGLERSVRVEGAVTKVSDGESDRYFQSRPPKSRLGAWASDQSEVAESREMIEKKWADLEKEYLDENEELLKPIERPPHWGGFRLVPDRIEFWKGRTARLHDRIVYEKPLPEFQDGAGVGKGGEWTRKRLQP